MAEDEFAKALGFFVWAWNDLHERLGHLYSAAVCDGHLMPSALAAWHSHNSDRGQRKMLVAAAEESLTTRPKLFTEIKWLSGRVDSLADKRNDAVHASYAILHSDEGASVIAHGYYGNKRSKGLERVSDLTGAFRGYKLETDTLMSFAEELFQCVVDANRPIPARPSGV